jgi:hypothetical protein
MNIYSIFFDFSILYLIFNITNVDLTINQFKTLLRSHMECNTLGVVTRFESIIGTTLPIT